MEETDKRSSTLSNDYFVKNNNKTNDVQKYNSIPSELKAIKKVEVKKLQLLSIDGWENYQKDLIRLCFEFWEVNETQAQVNSLNSDLNINNLEIQMPTSLFAEKKNSSDNRASKATPDHILSSKIFPIEGNNQIIKSQRNEFPVFRQEFKVINNNTGWKKNVSCSDIVNIRRNKRSQGKKFSFYKQMSKVKPNKTFQSFTFDRSASCSLEDLWKYKNWLDSVERIKKCEPIIDITSDNSDKINYDEKNDKNTSLKNVLDIEAKEMEQKVRKLIKSLKEKDKLFPQIDVNEQKTKSGSSNKFKYLFKNVFRGNQNEIDLHLLDDYIKYAKKKLHTWQTLLTCLEDIKQKESGKTKVIDLSEDNIKYRFSEKKEHYDKKISEEFDEKNFKIVVIDNGSNKIGNWKKKKFFKLRSKTKNSMDMRTATVKRIERKNIDNIVMNDDYLHWKSNTFDGNKENKFLLGWSANNRITPYQFRRSLSDTDLMAMVSANFDERSHGRCMTMTRFGWKTLSNETTNEENQHWYDENLAYEELWEERQECFQTALARLEYVGSTLKDQCRLAGLKTLCKVDILAGFGHSAEAVDLFVSTLPMSKNPELMIRKAEAAYDWKFFCHLSMWRHSYKEL